jgi:hypothetical protein
MNSFENRLRSLAMQQTRRYFLQGCPLGLASIWIAAQGSKAQASEAVLPQIDMARPMAPRQPHFAPRAKRVIYLHMAGSPSQLELFDYKPQLVKYDGKDCPQSFLEGKQFAFIQGIPKLLGPLFPFKQHGRSGHWLSDRLEFFPEVIDSVCMLKAMYTDQFNHGPAQLMMHTGNANPGSPCAGSWATYGLGAENENLPGFIALTSGGKTPDAGKSVWGSGYLPSVFQGVQCRSQGDPVLFLSNPPGISTKVRRLSLDAVADINRQSLEALGDPETQSRIAQYELAFRMQTHASQAFDITQESADTLALYGAEPGKESFANNCLLARRLVERGVRFVNLFDWGWDSHGAAESEALNAGFKGKVKAVDKPMTALIKDLDRCGLLQDTLVIFSGEFGRTPMRENRGGSEMKYIGRDHHPSAFTMWMAGGGVKPGFAYGETDELGYEAVVNRTSVHDFHATLLHLLGFDHERLTYYSQGVNQRLSNITKPGSRVISDIIA